MNRFENLFELIRKENVVIWAGVGLSLYAGYPSGKQLVNFLYNTLSITEKREIDKSLTLPDFAETYYRIKEHDMSSIIHALNKIFTETPPKSIEHHKKLATIPHFKTIITTNYDQLFEKAYGQKGQVAFLSKQIPGLKKSNVSILKVHGDLSEPETIIIKSSDYEHFFETGSENDIFWTKVKEQIAGNSILFLGYNLEDINARVLFNRITKALGKFRNPCYLIAPNFSISKKNDLKKSKIIYIDTTAEIFIVELIENIKSNIYSDYNKKWISVETLKDFIITYKVHPDLKIEGNDLKLVSLRAASKGVRTQGNFTIKLDKDQLDRFKSFVSGETLGEFEFIGKNIVNLEFDVGGINWPIFKEEGKLVIKSRPLKELQVDVRFKDGFEVYDVPVKIYISKSQAKIEIDLISASLEVTFKPSSKIKSDINFLFKHHPQYSKVKDEIKLFTILKKLTDGEEITVFWDFGKKKRTFRPSKAVKFHKTFSSLLQYFENLHLIERHYHLQFSGITQDSLTEESYHTVNLIISAIKKIPTPIKNEITRIELNDYSPEVLQELKKQNIDQKPLMACLGEKEIISLHDQTIDLGYKHIEFKKPRIENIDAILSGGKKELIIESEEIYLSYSETPEP